MTVVDLVVADCERYLLGTEPSPALRKERDELQVRIGRHQFVAWRPIFLKYPWAQNLGLKCATF